MLQALHLGLLGLGKSPESVCEVKASASLKVTQLGEQQTASRPVPVSVDWLQHKFMKQWSWGRVGSYLEVIDRQICTLRNAVWEKQLERVWLRCLENGSAFLQGGVILCLLRDGAY